MTTKPRLPSVALYVDAQHLWRASREFARSQGIENGRLDYDALLGFVCDAIRRKAGADDVRVVFQRIYTASRNRALAFRNALEQFGYTVNEHILRSTEDTFDWDTQIVVDLLADNRASGRADYIVIVSGDSDFLPVETPYPDLIVMGFPGSTSAQFKNIVYLDGSVLYAG